MTTPTKATLNTIGAANGAQYTADHTTNRANFETILQKEIITAFEATNVFLNLYQKRLITSGSGAKFYNMGHAKAYYREKGKPYLGDSNVPFNSITINVDETLEGSVHIDSLDEAMFHTDVRQRIARDIGARLAEQMDIRLARLSYKAASMSALNKDHKGGHIITSAKAKTETASLVKAIYDAACVLDENDVPKEGRFIVVAPAQKYLLLQDHDLINRDIGGTGSYQKAIIGEVAGMPLYMSNHLPNGKNITTKETGEVNDYTGDFTNHLAIVGHRDAIATVQLQGVQTFTTGTDYSAIMNGVLLGARCAVGHGVIDPRGMVAIKTA